MAGLYGRYLNEDEDPLETKKTGKLSAILSRLTPLSLTDNKPDFSVDKTLAPQPTDTPTSDENTPISQPEQSGGRLKNLWEKISSPFKAEVTDSETEAPKVEEGVGHKIMRYALPALMSLSGGAGILPGLLTGMAGSAKGRQEDIKNKMSFNKLQAAKEIAADKLKSQQTQQDTTNKFKSANLRLAKERLDLQQANKLTSKEQKLIGELTDEDMTELDTAIQNGDIQDLINSGDEAAAAYNKWKTIDKIKGNNF